VVFHDATLSRSSGGRDQRRVGDVHLAELRAMGVPTLEEALWWARSNGVGVNVEMKHDLVNRMALARETVHAIRVTGADVLLSSFDPLLLALASVLAPRVARALIVHAGQPLWADVLQRVVGPPYVQALHIERTQATPGTQRTTNLDMGWYLRRTLRVGVWTVNDPREALELVRLGAASIITDAPGAILQALTRS
jgi:glycerophosphoryl diester phosphodiesterase